MMRAAAQPLAANARSVIDYRQRELRGISMIQTSRRNEVAATRRGLLLGATALAAMSSACATQAQPATSGVNQKRATDVANSLFAAQPVPALSLAVADASGVIWDQAFGKANIELDIAATPAHRFKLGSVSKVLTATAAAKLSARGVLDLDAPISTWLPDLPEPHRQTTTRQLLTHRGGVRHYARKDMDLAAPSGPIDVASIPPTRKSSPSSSTIRWSPRRESR
jgi:serine beta-lactamase-like protein LACTB